MPNFSDPASITPTNEGLQLKFNGQQFFEAVIRTVHDAISIYAGAPKLGAGTIPAWLKVVAVSSSKERDAYVLIAQSVMLALRAQLAEEIGQFHLDEDDKLVQKNDQVKFTAFELLDSQAYTLKVDHFKRPETFPFLADFGKAYQSWLRDNFGMSAIRAQGLASVYPYYFGNAFYDELRAGSYPDLRAWQSDPLLTEHVQLLKRERYAASLKEYYFAPSLGQQEVALADIYIEPDFLVLDKLLTQERREALREKGYNQSGGHFLRTDYPHSIHDYFRYHFLQGSRSKEMACSQEESRMLILLGQPGHGKSSFCYRTAYDLLHNPDYQGTVHLIRLRETGRELFQDPLAEFAKLLSRQGIAPQEDWQSENTQSVLLLDGLDELCMSQGLSDQEVKDFLQRCKQLVQDYPQLYLVITSRFNYIPSDHMRQSRALMLSLATLNTTQQQQLIVRYQAVKQTEVNIDIDFLKEINEEDQYKHLKELIELPIILQILLLSETDIKAANSRADIYDELFAKVLERKWDKEGRLQKYIDANDFSPEDLRQYLSFLALKIYQAPEAYLNRTQISNYPETKEFIREFLTIRGKKEDGIDTVLKDVLTSFYLTEKRKSEEDREEEASRQQYAIEFLHKSLYEYLACDYLWQQIKDIFLKPTGKPHYRNFESIGTELQTLFGYTRLSEEMLAYLAEIIATDTACHTNLQEAMVDLLPEMLQYGCLYHYALPGAKLPQPYTPGEQARHVLHAYLAILGQLRLQEVEEATFWGSDWDTFYTQYLADKTPADIIRNYGIPNSYENDASFTANWEATAQSTDIAMSAQYYFRAAVYRQALQSSNTLTTTIWQQLAPQLRDLGTARLPMQLNLRGALLAEQDLRGCYMPYLKLAGADLRGADLRGADLRGADLLGADLLGADLLGADLLGAYLLGAYLLGAYLLGAILSSPAQLSNIQEESKADIFARYIISEEEEIDYYGATIKGYRILAKPRPKQAAPRIPKK